MSGPTNNLLDLAVVCEGQIDSYSRLVTVCDKDLERCPKQTFKTNQRAIILSFWFIWPSHLTL